MDTISEEKKKHEAIFEEHIRLAHDRLIAGFPRDGGIVGAACTILADRLIYVSSRLALLGVDPALIGDYAAAIARGTLARAALEKKGATVAGEAGAAP